MRRRYRRPLCRQRALELAHNQRKLIKSFAASSRHRYSSVSTRTNDSSPTITRYKYRQYQRILDLAFLSDIFAWLILSHSRTVTPIPLEFAELPDPFVPKDEWAVVNVSGQRFHINMDHVKLHHPTTLLGSAGTWESNVFVSILFLGALRFWEDLLGPTTLWIFHRPPSWYFWGSWVEKLSNVHNSNKFSISNTVGAKNLRWFLLS